MIQWGKNQNPKNSLDQKINPPKNPLSEFLSLKVFKCMCLWLGCAGTTMSLQIVLKTPKNPYLYQAPQKKYLPNFPTQKIWELKIQTQKNPSIIPVP